MGNDCPCTSRRDAQYPVPTGLRSSSVLWSAAFEDCERPP